MGSLNVLPSKNSPSIRSRSSAEYLTYFWAFLPLSTKGLLCRKESILHHLNFHKESTPYVPFYLTNYFGSQKEFIRFLQPSFTHSWSILLYVLSVIRESVKNGFLLIEGYILLLMQLTKRMKQTNCFCFKYLKHFKWPKNFLATSCWSSQKTSMQEWNDSKNQIEHTQSVWWKICMQAAKLQQPQASMTLATQYLEQPIEIAFDEAPQTVHWTSWTW